MTTRGRGGRGGDRGVGHVMEKLRASVERGDYYEAQQMYRTVYFRYMGLEKYGDALQLLQSGATLLLKAGQYASGADLALLILDIYTQTHTMVNEESIARIRAVFPLLPADHIRDKFIKNAMEWSRTEGENTRGSPDLHHLFGMAFYKEHNYVEAQRHLLHGTDVDARALGDMLVHWSLSSQPDTPMTDVLVARVVLPLLCLGDLKRANIVFERFISKHHAVEHFPFPSLPLLDFLYLLLPTCERDAAQLFTALKNQYKAHIDRDASVAQ
eukprot:Ihof_evm2s1045 gene=Ihof_evmTU2s1045